MGAKSIGDKMENKILNEKYKIRRIIPEDNSDMANLVRYNLKNHALDIPGTAYFDPSLDNLCAFYSESEKRGYYVLTDENDKVLGGVGFAEFEVFEGCAELQKLYLDDSVKGKGIGYAMMEFIESKVKEAGYNKAYLETHSNLKVAIHLYEKIGYERIERPCDVAHGAMDYFFLKKL